MPDDLTYDSDTQEKPDNWPIGGLLDAMREVAREEHEEEIQNTAEWLLRVERRVAALEAMNPPAVIWTGTRMDSTGATGAPIVPPAPAPEDDPGSCPKCGQSFEMVRPGKSQPMCDCWEAPAPEPSEEAELLLDCLEEIDPDNSPWLGLRTHMDDLRYCQRIIDVLKPRLEREAGERAVRRFAAFCEAWDGDPHKPWASYSELTERFLKEGA